MKIYSIEDFPFKSDIPEDQILEWLEYIEQMRQRGIIIDRR